jgi:ribosome-binding factor A
MRSFPRARAMSETVREVIARILLEEIADPRVEFVTVTGVDLSPDLRYATIYIATPEGSDPAQALEGLSRATGPIRSLLGERVRARYTAELTFKIDPAIEEATRIAGALKRERDLGRVPAQVVEEDVVDDDV